MVVLRSASMRRQHRHRSNVPQSSRGMQETEDKGDRQCRICLQGEDPALGRLIKPCKCNGSIRFVHVQCLDSWRKTATSRSAFFVCPQCHYKYRFSRTKVIGLATSPLVITVFSLTLFIAVVFVASFIGSFILKQFDDSDASYSSYSYWFYDPITATRDLIASAVHLVDDISGSSSSPLSSRKQRDINWSSTTPLKMPPSRPGIISRLVQRFMLGLSVVGITSFAQWLWSMSLMGPMRWFRFRGLRDRRDRGGGTILSVVVLVFVIAGAARTLLSTYRFVERKTQQFLVRAEYSILEVGD